MREAEQWADVPGYEGFYQVSNYGRVMRCKQILPKLVLEGVRKHRRELTQIPRGRGQRLSVSLCVDNKPKWFQVHRLVLLAFRGEPTGGAECRHMDGNHLNNWLGNLQWGTHTENMNDKTAHGTQIMGEAHHKAKLTEDDIRMIRASGSTMRELAAHYGVSQVAICFIKNRKTWKHVA